MAGEDMDITVDVHDIEWDFESLRDWQDMRDRLYKANIYTSTKNLDKFVYFQTKTIHKICNCLIYHIKIP